MIKFLKNLLNPGPVVNLQELIEKGAVIIDVRTEGEFRSGHVKGSINIPLDRLNKNLSKLRKDEPIITCCASGMRSGTALNILKNHGFSKVYNAGSWRSIKVNE